jgi:hypothetical protein
VLINPRIRRQNTDSNSLHERSLNESRVLALWETALNNKLCPVGSRMISGGRPRQVLASSCDILEYGRFAVPFSHPEQRGTSVVDHKPVPAILIARISGGT